MSAIPYYLRLILRTLISFLDGLIYHIDAALYDLMIKIAKAEVFTDATINDVASRVYQLLALIMMFRLIFIFMTYIINPDSMTDKTKGYSNIIKKIIITLALIIITPWGFREARNIQTVILDDHVIEYFILGQNRNSGASSGYELMHTVGMLFVTPYTCNSDCKTVEDYYSSNTEKKLCSISDWDLNTVTLRDNNGNLSCGSNCGTLCGYGAGEDESYAQALQDATNLRGTTYNLEALMSLAKFGKKTDRGWNSDWYVEYRFPFVGTTLVGVVIGYMLIVMCIDIAIRSVKLSFYQLIAPVPIISYIGPKDGKDTMLNKWFNQTLKTYCDLFTRVAGLQIAVFFINSMLTNGVAKNDIFVSLFLIIGALTFAKKLPDILKDLGVNFDGGGFNLKKKLNDNIAGKRAINAGLGFAGGLAANTLKMADNQFRRREKIRKEAREHGYDNVKLFKKTREFDKWKNTNHGMYGSNPLAGAFSAAARAATAKDGNLFSGAAAGIKASVDTRDTRDKREDAGYGFTTRKLDSVRSFAGIDTEAKDRANKLRDDIAKKDAEAYNFQNQMSTNQQIMDSNSGIIQSFEERKGKLAEAKNQMFREKNEKGNLMEISRNNMEKLEQNKNSILDNLKQNIQFKDTPEEFYQSTIEEYVANPSGFNRTGYNQDTLDALDNYKKALDAYNTEANAYNSFTAQYNEASQKYEEAQNHYASAEQQANEAKEKIANAESRYKAALQGYQKTQSDKTKLQKKLGLYEREKK